MHLLHIISEGNVAYCHEKLTFNAYVDHTYDEVVSMRSNYNKNSSEATCTMMQLFDPDTPTAALDFTQGAASLSAVCREDLGKKLTPPGTDTIPTPQKIAFKTFHCH